MRIVILGAGGHAQVVAESVLRCKEAGADLELVGFLDDASDKVEQVWLGIPILGPIGKLSEIDHDACIIGIGSNHIRNRIYTYLKSLGERFVSVVHPRSVVAHGVLLGDGSVIVAGAIVNSGAVIGDNVILNTGCTVDHNTSIHHHAHIAPGAHLGGNVEIGEGSLIGIGATVMPQRRVGTWSVVGAGALVRDDVADRATVVGVPAKVITVAR